MNMFNSVILLEFWDKSETKNIIKILEWFKNIVIDKELYRTLQCWFYKLIDYYYGYYGQDEKGTKDFYGGRTGPLEKFYLFIFYFI